MTVSEVLSPAERLARLRLARTLRVGPVTFRALLERFATAEDALTALPGLARRGGAGKPPAICTPARAAAEIEAGTALGAHLLVLGDRDYPAPLAAIDDAPPVLHALGDTALLERTAIAVVGARNASANGRAVAERMAEGLSAAGYVVVSGLARGVDGAAHGAALEGGTIAVMAGGVDVVFPPEHKELHAAIGERGLLLSEMPPGLRPQGRHFPRRNRIISGLARGVVVIEAALRSGSLITARQALQQGREVFAVPGAPLDPRGRGGNLLIRDGAGLVERAEDVIALLQAAGSLPLHPPVVRETIVETEPYQSTQSTQEDADLDGLLSTAPCDIDELIRRSRLTASQVLTILLELELAGRLTRYPGNRVALAGER